MLKPWEIVASFSEDRIDAIAHIINDARGLAADLANEEYGDDSWAVQCRSYSFARHALLKASLREEFDYLEIVDSSLNFEMSIDGHPARISRDDPDAPSIKCRNRATTRCSKTIDMGFARMWRTNEVSWIFVISTGPDYIVLSVSLLGLLRDGTVVARYDVDLRGAIRRLYVVDDEWTDAYNPEPPAIGFEGEGREDDEYEHGQEQANDADDDVNDEQGEI